MNQKKLFFVSLAINLFSSAQAHPFSSALSLRTTDNNIIIASLDNAPYNTPGTLYSVEGLEPGNHFLRISRMVYTRHWRRSYPVTAFEGYVNIPTDARVNAVLDDYNRLKIRGMMTNTLPAPFPEPVHYTPVCEQTYNREMNDYDFQSLKETIASKNFESTRISILRSVMPQNLFTTRQVSELMTLMTFENTKLEVAKLAYPRTVDQRNYFLVNNQFVFESSIEDLNRYIASL